MIDSRNLPDDPQQLKKLVVELMARLEETLAAQAKTQELLTNCYATSAAARARNSPATS